jgi:hypothetical protein
LDEKKDALPTLPYRRDGTDRQQVMALATDEFIRRFLLHGLLAGASRQASLDRARELLAVAPPPMTTGRRSRSTRDRHALAAWGAWSSSRPSPDGTNRARRRRAPH